ncbi:hypothetical protein AB0J55_00560 [Amycolatopsis sp. NPDC049688]|uniref:hypothetical protein n=1 Tax=Amycolatopsis sp. NPDC049688 TaxID=3154733 RepID=UPI003442F0AC
MSVAIPPARENPAEPPARPPAPRGLTTAIVMVALLVTTVIDRSLSSRARFRRLVGLILVVGAAIFLVRNGPEMLHAVAGADPGGNR